MSCILLQGAFTLFKHDKIEMHVLWQIKICFKGSFLQEKKIEGLAEFVLTPLFIASVVGKFRAKKDKVGLVQAS